MSHTFDIIVIGGGPAGVTAALQACELGASVALIERGRMGGTCTNDGCAPTRVLAKAARLIRDAEQFGLYALRGEAPVLDFPALLARTQAIIGELHEKKDLVGHLTRSGVVVLSQVGNVRFADSHHILLPDGQRLHAEQFILCAGGHARRLTFPGAQHTLTHSDVWQMEALPGKLAIVGGSATGCQLASIFNAFGAAVTLLETAPRPLPSEDEMIAQALTAVHSCASSSFPMARAWPTLLAAGDCW